MLFSCYKTEMMRRISMSSLARIIKVSSPFTSIRTHFADSIFHYKKRNRKCVQENVFLT